MKNNDILKAFGFSGLALGMIAFGRSDLPSHGFGYDGGGVSITPYGRTETVKVADVASKKAAASLTALLRSNLEPGGTEIPNARLAFFRGGKRTSPAVTTIVGFSGKVKKVVDLAELSLLQVVSTDPPTGTANVRFELFPHLTPAKLVQDQPTYVQLEPFRVTLTLRVKVSDSQGSTLCLFEGPKENPSSPDGLVTRPLSAFTGEKALRKDLPHSGLWWAIPSVAYSRSYPFKLASAD